MLYGCKTQSEKNNLLNAIWGKCACTALVPIWLFYFHGGFMEIWKDIKGFEGLYQVSNQGRIKSIISNKILKQIRHHKGYIITCLTKNKIHKTYQVHRLVGAAFVPNPNKYPHINHKDENPTNNSAENLEWCTQKYNNNYGTRIEKAKIAISKRVGQYDLNGNLICVWDSLTKASNELNICLSGISQCCKNRHKTAGGFVWKYEKKEA